MRKVIIYIFLALIGIITLNAQNRGTKIGYIDMEYILKNVPNYIDAQNQLEQKAEMWKQEIEAKKLEITVLKDALQAEKPLLTKGLIEERNSEIAFLEKEHIEYQQKRFGPNGDLITLKNGLTKPVQDQVFTAIQDIAEAKKYDFIFDKTSDLTMLFAANRFDISDQIVRILNRSEKREQMTKKQLKEEEEKDAAADAIADNPDLSERQRSLETKKSARDAAIAAKIQAQEERRKEIEDRKLQIAADREAKKNGVAPTKITRTSSDDSNSNKEAAVKAATDAQQAQSDQRAEVLKQRLQGVEDRKKALEERKLQILADREARKNGTPAGQNNAVKESEAKAVPSEIKQNRDEKTKQNSGSTDTKKSGTISENTAKETEVAVPVNKLDPKNPALPSAAELAKQKQADDRAKILEDRRKALEDKRTKILEDREAIRKANEEKLKTTK